MLDDVHKSAPRMLFVLFYVLTGTILIFGLVSGLLTDLLFHRALRTVAPSSAAGAPLETKEIRRGWWKRIRNACTSKWWTPYATLLIWIFIGVAWFCHFGLIVSGEKQLHPS